MPTEQERIDSLSSFKEIELFRFQLNKVKYKVKFCPKFSICLIQTKNMPDIALSYKDFVKDFYEKSIYPKRDVLSNILRKVKGLWQKMPEEKQNNLIDNVPLNAFVLMGEYLN